MPDAPRVIFAKTARILRLLVTVLAFFRMFRAQPIQRALGEAKKVQGTSRTRLEGNHPGGYRTKRAKGRRLSVVGRAKKPRWATPRSSPDARHDHALPLDAVGPGIPVRACPGDRVQPPGELSRCRDACVDIAHVAGPVGAGARRRAKRGRQVAPGPYRLVHVLP
jgi:hypothetical protein